MQPELEAPRMAAMPFYWLCHDELKGMHSWTTKGRRHQTSVQSVRKHTTMRKSQAYLLRNKPVYAGKRPWVLRQCFLVLLRGFITREFARGRPWCNGRRVIISESSSCRSHATYGWWKLRLLRRLIFVNGAQVRSCVCMEVSC